MIPNRELNYADSIKHIKLVTTILFLIAIFVPNITAQDTAYPQTFHLGDWCVVSSPKTIHAWTGTGSLSGTTDEQLDTQNYPAELCPTSTVNVVNYTTCNLYVTAFTCNTTYLTEQPTSYHVPFLYGPKFIEKPQIVASCIESGYYNQSSQIVFNCHNVNGMKTDAYCEEACFDNPSTNTSCSCSCSVDDSWCLYGGWNVTECTDTNVGGVCSLPDCCCIDQDKTIFQAITNGYCGSETSWALISHPTAFYSSVNPVNILPDLIFAEFTGTTVIIVIDDGITGASALARKGSYAETFAVDGFRVIHEIPRSAYVKSGTLQITLYDINGHVIKNWEFPVTGIKTCELHDCIWCRSSFNNFSCLPPAIQTAVVVFLIFLFLIVIALFKPVLLPFLSFTVWFIFGSLIWFLKFLFFFYRNKFTIFIIDKLCMLKDMLRDWLDGTNTAQMKPELKSDMADEMQEKKSTRGGFRFIFNVLIYSALILGVFACEEGVTIPINVNLCNTANGIETCRVDFESLITIPFVGGEACLTFSDGNNVVQHAIITYVADRASVSLNTQYYTSGYHVEQQSHKHCLGLFGVTGKDCTYKLIKSIASTDRTMKGHITNIDIVDRPGDSTFNIRANSDCVASKNCVYSAYGIDPMGTVIRVQTPGGFVQQPLVNVRIQTNDMDISKQISVNNQKVNVNNLFFSIEGQLSNPQISFGDQKILTEINSLDTYLANAADKGIPAGFSWGSIQSNSNSGLSSPKNGSFIFNPAIIGVQNDAPGHTSWNWVQFAPDPAPEPFPTDINGNMWFYEAGKLVSNVTNPGSLVLRISSGTSYTISRKVQAVCPKLLIEREASGCYSCSQGSTLPVTMLSSCMPGTVSITADKDYIKIDTKSIRLSTNEENFLINFETSQQDNNFNLLFVGSGSSLSVPVSFQAIEDITLPDEIFIDSNSTQVDAAKKDSGFSIGDFGNVLGDGFDGIFDGSGSWWHYLLFGIFIIVGFFLIFAGMAITCPWFVGSLRNMSMIMYSKKEKVY